jgi:hypothetical protein
MVCGQTNKSSLRESGWHEGSASFCGLKREADPCLRQAGLAALGMTPRAPARTHVPDQIRESFTARRDILRERRFLELLGF